MKSGRDGISRQRLHVLFDVGAIGNLDDDQLLRRFATGHGEAAELAFAALVERHGSGVLRACRAVLRDEHEAHDAFQATFLVLVRKASRLRVGESLGPWLRQVAYRVAQGSRRAAARRQRHERRYGELAPPALARPEPRPDDGLQRLVAEELACLPACYREVVGLCDLEGYPLEAAAKLLGRPLGTVKSRLARGRRRLRARLLRRGVVAPAVGLPAALAFNGPASAAVPARLADATVRAARHAASGGSVSPAIEPLVQGVLSMMFPGKMKLAMTALLAAGLGATGAVTVARQSAPAPAAASAPRPSALDDAALELDRLDVELLRDEVKQLRQQLADALRARQQPGGNDAYEAVKSSYVVKRRQLMQEQHRLAGLANEGKPLAPEPPSTPPAVNVGAVNVEEILKRSVKAAEANQKSKQTLASLQEQLKAHQDQLQKLVGERNPITQADASTRALDTSIALMKGKFDVAREHAQLEMASVQTNALKALVQEIRSAIAEVAKAKGLAYVVTVSSSLDLSTTTTELQNALGRSVLYADPRIDITEEVIRRLNAPSGATADPNLRGR